MNFRRRKVSDCIFLEVKTLSSDAFRITVLRFPILNLGHKHPIMETLIINLVTVSTARHRHRCGNKRNILSVERKSNQSLWCSGIKRKIKQSCSNLDLEGNLKLKFPSPEAIFQNLDPIFLLPSYLKQISRACEGWPWGRRCLLDGSRQPPVLPAGSVITGGAFLCVVLSS